MASRHVPSATGGRRRGAAADHARRLGPLPGLALALVLVVAVLPSSLNLPQSNPTTTPEFAPVSPQDQKQAPPQAGNFAGVGFASDLGVDGSAGALPPGVPQPGPLQAMGKTPTTKLCVGNPPRQTEDPLSPPCVAYFNGDNGGATGVGVTGTTVRLLWALEGQSTEGSETSPSNAVFDLCRPAVGQENRSRRILRAWQAYFNFRYQTYGRKVCISVSYSANQQGSDSTAVESPEGRRAQAIDLFGKVRPFATVARLSNNNYFEEELARRGVVIFGDSPPDLSRKYPGHFYGYAPPLTYEAHRFATYVCQKVKPHPVIDSGNLGDNGKPRTFGLIWANDKTDPTTRQYKEAFVREVSRCGVTFVAEGVIPYRSTTLTPGHCNVASDCGYGARQMPAFSQKGVTTILWVGGNEVEFSHAAASLGYHPEWIIGSQLGDNQNGILNGSAQEQSEWAHATVVDQLTRLLPTGDSRPCDEAYAQVRPGETADRASACGTSYADAQQIFTGIQVAGPRLTVQSLDQGLHAIPPHPSSDPYVPACFYDPGDYTCVKDATVLYWDAAAPNALGTTGCFRMSEDGRRYLPDAWPNGNSTAQRRAGRDVCQTWEGGGSP